MSSSRHLSDSGRVGKEPAPEKSNFVHTCNLLSRYIKKKGNLRNLNLEIGGQVESLESISIISSFLNIVVKLFDIFPERRSKL